MKRIMLLLAVVVAVVTALSASLAFAQAEPKEELGMCFVAYPIGGSLVFMTEEDCKQLGGNFVEV